MNIYCLSIFPEIFDSFKETSLIGKAIEKGLITFQTVNPREYCTDKHQQIDDEPYGGGAGLVMKAQPIIDAIKKITQTSKKFCVVSLEPSKEEFVQSTAHELVEYDTLIFLCGRYEGIDHRVSLWCEKEFGKNYKKLSLGKFVTLGGETPAMVMSEAIVRLIPGVIKEEESRKKESYRPEKGGSNIEHPHYTRPQEVEGFQVPEVLLSGDHAKIEEWRSRE